MVAAFPGCRRERGLDERVQVRVVRASMGDPLPVRPLSSRSSRSHGLLFLSFSLVSVEEFSFLVSLMFASSLRQCCFYYTPSQPVSECECVVLGGSFNGVHDGRYVPLIPLSPLSSAPPASSLRFHVRAYGCQRRYYLNLTLPGRTDHSTPPLQGG